MIRHLGSLITCLVIAACAGNTPGSGTPSGERGGQRQSGRCGPAAFPVMLPPLDSIIDSSAVASEVEGASGVYLIAFVIDGPPIVGVLDPGTDSSAAAIVQRQIANNLKPQPSTRDPWGLRVIVSGGENTALIPARTEFCPPTMDEERRVVRTSIQAVPASQMPSIRSNMRIRNRFRYRALVGADGRVVRVEVIQSTGDLSADSDITRALERGRYQPATLGGLPVTAWHQTSR